LCILLLPLQNTLISVPYANQEDMRKSLEDQLMISFLT